MPCIHVHSKQAEPVRRPVLPLRYLQPISSGGEQYCKSDDLPKSQVIYATWSCHRFVRPLRALRTPIHACCGIDFHTQALALLLWSTCASWCSAFLKYLEHVKPPESHVIDATVSYSLLPSTRMTTTRTSYMTSTTHKGPHFTLYELFNTHKFLGATSLAPPVPITSHLVQIHLYGFF